MDNNPIYVTRSSNCSYKFIKSSDKESFSERTIFGTCVTEYLEVNGKQYLNKQILMGIIRKNRGVE